MFVTEAARGPSSLRGLSLRAVQCASALAGWLFAHESHAQRPTPAPPVIVSSPVPFGAARVAQTAAYARRHSGDESAVLEPRAIVLHYTCGPSYVSTWRTFASNTPYHREAPGVCAHYVIDFDGTIHELVPPNVRCHHTIGLNHVALGIEFVQPCVRSARRAERALRARTAQWQAGLRLVEHLQRRYRIPRENILGHAMANTHALFVDRTGARNDHGDWRPHTVQLFTQQLQAQ